MNLSPSPCLHSPLKPRNHYLRSSPSHFLRSSKKHQEPLPSIFFETQPSIFRNPSLQSSQPSILLAFDLLAWDLVSLWSYGHGFLWLLEKNEEVGGAWVLMVAWDEQSWRKKNKGRRKKNKVEERSCSTFTELGFLRLEFHVEYNSTSTLPAHITRVFKTWVCHGTQASKA